MNEIALYGEKRMTVKEVAEVFGVDPEAIKKHIRELFPNIMRNGITTYLTEAQVTEIKKHMIPTTSVVAAVTALEIEEMTIRVLSYHKAEADRLRAELATAAPKIEAAEALMACEKTMSITDAAKHFGLHPKTEVFPYLRDNGYLTARDVPTQAAIDAGYLALREARCADGEVRRQAVVLANQLDTWRLRVVPQVKKWAAV